MPLLLLLIDLLFAVGHSQTVFQCSVSFDNALLRASDKRLIGGYNDVLGPVQNVTYFDEGLLLSSQMLYNGILRHPGGTVANYWTFANASYVTPCNTSNYDYCKHQHVVEKLPPHTFSPGHFSAGIGSASVVAHGDKPNSVVYDLNLLTLEGDPLLNELSVLQKEVGANNVKYIELGNEYYLNQYAYYFPNSTVYMHKAVPVMQQIRRVFPSAKISVSADKLNYNQGVGVGDSDTNENVSPQEWNAQLSAFTSFYDSVTIHDYTLNAGVVQNLDLEQQMSVIAIYGRSVIPQYVDYVRNVFGPNKTIWMTEYNCNFENETLGYSVVHSMFALSYITAAICDPTRTMELLLWHLYATQIGNEWGTYDFVTSLSAMANDSAHTKFNVVGQLFAQLGYISMVKNNQMTCLDFTAVGGTGTASECPLLGIKVAQNANLQCLFGSGFRNSNDANSFGFVIVNACATNTINLQLQLSTMSAGAGAAAVLLDIYQYAAQSNDGARNAKFVDCAPNHNVVWDPACAAVAPEHTQMQVSAGQKVLSVDIRPLEVMFAVTQ